MSDKSFRKFYGLSSEDGDRFLSDFEAFSTLKQLNGPANDCRKVAAFILHLEGPASTWYRDLPDRYKQNWHHLSRAFTVKYIDFDPHDNPNIVAESELYNQLKLENGQPIEVFHANIVEKGRKLRKTNADMIAKFIEGLPSKLAFYVRAGRPNTQEAALTSAKMGEAYGYRILSDFDTQVPKVCSVKTEDSVVIELRDQVKALNEAIRSLQLNTWKGQQDYFTPLKGLDY